MNRRYFLKASLAGTAIPALAGVSRFSLADTFSNWGGGLPELAISDTRFAACQRFDDAKSRRVGQRLEQVVLHHGAYV